MTEEEKGSVDSKKEYIDNADGLVGGTNHSSTRKTWSVADRPDVI
jgi:hypothetical protein